MPTISRVGMSGGSERSGVLSLGQRPEWDAAVRRCLDWDVYHLAGYHGVAAGTDGGDPRLFWYESGQFVACLPYLKRALNVDGVAGAGTFDATSAYGYPGPISSNGGIEDPVMRAGFQGYLAEHFERENIVSLFVRHESRESGAWLLDGMGETVSAGETVWVDLAAGAAARSAASSSSHRYKVRRAVREGLTVVEAADAASIEEFAGIYQATMARLGAAPYYRFASNYFHALFGELGPRAKLLLAENSRGSRVAGAVILRADDMVQYHLGGRVDGEDSEFAMRLVLHEAAERGAAEGGRRLNLGGGLGGRQDGLFRFKAGFSGLRGRFLVSRCVFDRGKYESLCEQRSRWMSESGAAVLDPAFFPRYRAPAGKPA